MTSAIERGEQLGLRTAVAFGSVLAAGGLAIGAAYLDKKWGAQKWPANQSQLYGLDADTSTATLSFGGCGSPHSKEEQEYISSVLPGDHGYWVYSNDVISTTQFAGELQAKAPNLKRANIFGQSAGGPWGMETLRLSNVHLDMIVLVDSPFDGRDIQSYHAARFADKYMQWHGGPGLKFVGAAFRRSMEGRTIVNTIAKAREDANSGCSPKLWLSGVRNILELDLQSHMAEYKELTSNETQILYCMSDKDTTLHNRQAAEKYEAFADDIGAPFDVVPVPNSSHADTQLASIALGKYLAARQKDRRYLTGGFPDLLAA